jgi:hypothetical protein
MLSIKRNTIFNAKDHVISRYERNSEHVTRHCERQRSNLLVPMLKRNKKRKHFQTFPLF